MGETGRGGLGVRGGFVDEGGGGGVIELAPESATNISSGWLSLIFAF